MTMHGIETFNRNSIASTTRWTSDVRFIQVDGHIGLEDEEKNAARFKKYFSYVETEPRYSLCRL